MFNGSLADRVLNGEFTLILRHTHPVPPLPNPEPAGTMSNTYSVLDEDGTRIAVVCAYVRQDGSLGGSGRYDPKCIVSDGVMYIL